MPAKKKETEQAVAQLEKAEVESRIVHLSGSVDDESAYEVCLSMLLLDEISHEPIKLFINSPGGEVNSGFSIFDCIRFLHSPVYILGAGLIASAAALIYAAVPKEQRISLPHSRYLLHQPLSGMRGVVTDLEIYSKEIDDVKALINTILSDASGKPVEQVEKDTDRDFWLTAQAAYDYGLVGSIVQNKQELDGIFSGTKKTPKKKAASTATKTTRAKASTTKKSSSTTRTKK